MSDNGPISCPGHPRLSCLIGKENKETLRGISITCKDDRQVPPRNCIRAKPPSSFCSGRKQHLTFVPSSVTDQVFIENRLEPFLRLKWMNRDVGRRAIVGEDPQSDPPLQVPPSDFQAEVYVALQATHYQRTTCLVTHASQPR